ncbi:hypothetical protein COO60DRAFT_1047316 [Scenedesmus sp. NREL 46B-D3]|nr:hypothetical protein COO60DRAFT_1047316 [Scenedesmus sp. NREL 46B-D3]
MLRIDLLSLCHAKNTLPHHQKHLRLQASPQHPAACRNVDLGMAALAVAVVAVMVVVAATARAPTTTAPAVPAAALTLAPCGQAAHASCREHQATDWLTQPSPLPARHTRGIPNRVKSALEAKKLPQPALPFSCCTAASLHRHPRMHGSTAKALKHASTTLLNKAATAGSAEPTAADVSTSSINCRQHERAVARWWSCWGRAATETVVAVVALATHAAG